jgi:membrane protein EpsK
MNSVNLRKQVTKNISMNMVSFIINVFIGLWTVPYLVKSVGIVAYGFVPLALMFAEYAGFIIQSLNASISRFLIIALQKNDYHQANQIYNTSLIVLLAFIVLQALIMSIVILNLSELINIPKSLENDVYWIFSLTAISFSISLMRGFFATILYANNRLDLIKIIEIFHQIIRVSVMVLFFSFDTPQLKYIGLANVIGVIFAFIWTYLLDRKLSGELRINFLLFDKSKVKEISSTGSWMLVNQIGMLLFLKVDLYLINKFVGATQAGMYAIISQVQYFIRIMLDVFLAAIWPLIMIYYAKNEIGKLVELSKIFVKLSAILLAIPIGLLCGSSEEVLQIWLGKHVEGLDNLLIFMLAPLVIHFATGSVAAIQAAYNKIKVPAIVLITLGCIKILLAIFLTTQTHLGIYGIILAGIIALSMMETIFMPIYTSYILKVPNNTFLNPLISGIFSFFIILSLILIIKAFINVDTFLNLLIAYSMVSIIALPIIFIAFISKKERAILYNIMPEKIKMRFPRGVIHYD